LTLTVVSQVKSDYYRFMNNNQRFSVKNSPG